MTDERTYIVTLDITDPELDVQRVRKGLTGDEDVSNWWNYLPGVYIIKTSLSVKQVSARVHELALDASFLVTEVDLSTSNGWLPDKAWNWIRKRGRERTRTA